MMNVMLGVAASLIAATATPKEPSAVLQAEGMSCLENSGMNKFLMFF